MKLIYKGKFDGDENSLPAREHPRGYKMFREPETPTKLAIVMNILALILTVLPLVPVMIVNKGFTDLKWYDYLGLILPMFCILPHEFLHALCFKGEVYLYTNFKQGSCFVMGLEDMTKGRFIILSLLPNIVFGFIPYALWMIFPHITFLGLFGAIAIGCGAGDYLNVFNCITQVPKGALTYMSGMHSYWYIPE